MQNNKTATAFAESSKRNKDIKKSSEKLFEIFFFEKNEVNNFSQCEIKLIHSWKFQAPKIIEQYPKNGNILLRVIRGQIKTSTMCFALTVSTRTN